MRQCHDHVKPCSEVRGDAVQCGALGRLRLCVWLCMGEPATARRVSLLTRTDSALPTMMLQKFCPCCAPGAEQLCFASLSSRALRSNADNARSHFSRAVHKERSDAEAILCLQVCLQPGLCDAGPGAEEKPQDGAPMHPGPPEASQSEAAVRCKSMGKAYRAKWCKLAIMMLRPVSVMSQRLVMSLCTVLCTKRT